MVCIRLYFKFLYIRTDHTEHKAIDFFSEPSPDLKSLHPFDDLCSPHPPPMTEDVFLH